MQDLRPNATIRCMVCDADKPQAGAVKFHAHQVCRDCVQKIQAKDKEKTK